MHSARPAGVVDILDRAVRLYQDNFALAIGVAALLLVPLNLMLATTLELTVGPMYSVFRDLERDLSKLTEVVSNYGGIQLFFTTIAVTGVYFLLYSLVAPVATGALYIALDAGHKGRRLTVVGAYRELFAVIWGYMGVVLLKGLVVVMGYLFFIVPGIALALLLSQAEVLALIERKSSLEALGRSRELMQADGAMWRMAGVVLLMVAASVIAGQIAQFGYVLVTGEGPGSFFVSTLLSAVPEILVLPLNIAALLVFYYDLRVRQEALDLELEASRLGLKAPGPAGPGEQP